MTVDETAADGPELLAWWLVATVGGGAASERDADEVRGVRHFSPGSRLWVLPPQWGDGGEHVLVVGRQRGEARRGWIRTVVPRRQLTGFRVRGVYSPAVLHRLTEPITLGWPARLWRGRDEAERAAARWNAEPGSPDGR